jgi:hypothetical protein
VLPQEAVNMGTMDLYPVAGMVQDLPLHLLFALDLIYLLIIDPIEEEKTTNS